MVYDPQNFFDEDEAKAEKLLPKISSYFSCIDPVQGTSGHAAVPVYPPKADLTHRPSEHPEHSKEIDRKHFPKIEKDQYDWDSEPQILGSDLEKHLSRSFPTEVEENHSEKNDQEAENAKKAPIHVSRMPRYRWNRSSITCPLCSRIYNNYNACRTHFKNVHNLKLLRKLMNYCVRTNHTCLLCNGRVTFETNVIKRHLRKFHGVSIQMYEDQFPLELESLFSSLTEKKTPNLPISDPKKGKSTLESVSGASSKSKQPPELSETSNGNLEISKTIESFEVSMKDKADSSVRSKFQWNQSTVPCPRCPKVYNSLNGCRMHLRTTHQIKSLNDVTIENSIRLKHTCLICNTQLTFEANLLSKHLEGVHKMTILTYENKFLLELKVMFSSLIEKLPLEFVECNTSQSLPAARNLETDSQSTCGTKHDIENNDTVPERVAKVGSSEKKRKNKKKAGLNDPRFQWNQSVISCPLCSQNFNNLNGCRMHLYTTHKKKSLKNLVIKNCVRPKHTCLLCYKKVTFETLMINQHLNKIHHVSIQTYENKFSAALESLFDIISSKESANTTPKNISESLPI